MGNRSSILTTALLVGLLGSGGVGLGASPPLPSTLEKQSPEVDKLRLDKAAAKRKRKAEKALKNR